MAPGWHINHILVVEQIKVSKRKTELGVGVKDLELESLRDPDYLGQQDPSCDSGIPLIAQGPASQDF